jgi:hypothetical protein
MHRFGIGLLQDWREFVTYGRVHADTVKEPMGFVFVEGNLVA